MRPLLTIMCSVPKCLTLLIANMQVCSGVSYKYGELERRPFSIVEERRGTSYDVQPDTANIASPYNDRGEYLLQGEEGII